MNRLFAAAVAIVAVLALAGCGSSGSSASPPTDVKVVPGDGYATVSWIMSPGVDYWIFYAQTSVNLTPQTCGSAIVCVTKINAISPQILTGLVNGATYSFTLNGRTNGGPGGPSSAAVFTVPRLAGAQWTTGSSAGASDLRGVAYGTSLVAVGAGGAIFSSPDGNAWTAVANPIASANPNLTAAVYGGNYMAAGAGGVILFSTDAITWTQQTSGTVNDLNALAANGAGGYVAVGANGTIIFSNGGGTWTAASTVPGSNALYGVTYGNGIFVAVGAGGTLLTSSDGNTWRAVVSNTSLDLKSIAFGAGTFVALSPTGTLVTSTDGVTWYPQTPIATNRVLNKVTFGRQFVAVGNGGVIFTSTDGLAWQVQTSGVSDNLYAVTGYTNSASGIGYSAVGASGRNVSSN
jgi:predicted small lipoprotein YifL